MARRFRDRVEAGKLLAERLMEDANRPDALALAAAIFRSRNTIDNNSWRL